MMPQPTDWRFEVNLMNAAAVVVEGKVQPDGSLELNEKVKLPAGPVQVTIRPVTETVQPDRFWKMMESIWADLRQTGRPVPTRKEINAQRRPMRREAEQEMQATERTKGSAPSQRATTRHGGNSLTHGISGLLPVIYLIEQPADFGPRVKARVSRLLASGDQLTVSDLVQMECRVGPVEGE